MLAGLDHPNIIDVLYMDKTEQDDPYFVMPFIEANLIYEIGEDTDTKEKIDDLEPFWRPKSIVFQQHSVSKLFSTGIPKKLIGVWNTDRKYIFCRKITLLQKSRIVKRIYNSSTICLYFFAYQSRQMHYCRLVVKGQLYWRVLGTQLIDHFIVIHSSI